MNANRFLLFPFLLFFAGSAASQSFNDSIMVHRTEYLNDFLKEERSPLKKDDLKYVDFYPANENYRVKGTFVLATDTAPFDMLTYSGKIKKYTEYGIVHFTIGKDSCTLHIYQSLSLKSNPEYTDYLFLPFKDETNGIETYGGGRYLDLRMSDIKGSYLVIDFNKSYNPYCAYSSGYSCPIPPDENHLKLKIEAGEKDYRKGHQ